MATETQTSAPNGVISPSPEPSKANGAVQPPEKKLSNAELKAQKKAEKEARRAQAKDVKGPQPSKQEVTPSSKTHKSQPSSPKPPQSKNAPDKQQPPPKSQQQGPKAGRSLETGAMPKVASKTVPVKRVGLFAHLYGQPRRHNTVGAGKDIHPAVLALGLQMSSYEICGSNARCVGMLLAFKSV